MNTESTTPEKPIEIDVWSDIVCPFCYVGKRRLEEALDSFEHASLVRVTWHSFQLDPETEHQDGIDIYDYLALRKGQTREWSLQAHRQVTQMAAEAGLTYDFDRTIVANSFDAHRLLQLGQLAGKGSEVKEKLLKAYFTEGRDIADHDTLVELGVQANLEAESIIAGFQNEELSKRVKDDLNTAVKYGINGVPFFIFNRRLGISGAQPVDVFLQALNQVYEEDQQVDTSV